MNKAEDTTNTLNPKTEPPENHTSLEPNKEQS